MSRIIRKVRLPDGRVVFEDNITMGKEEPVTVYEYRTRFWGCIVDKSLFKTDYWGRIRGLTFLD